MTARTVPIAMTRIPNSSTRRATILDTEHHLSLESLRKQAVGIMNAKGTAVKQPYNNRGRGWSNGKGLTND